MRSSRIHAIFLSVMLVGCSAPKSVEEPKVAKKLSKAPEKYQANFTTTKGDFVVEVTRAWAPRGSDRFYELIEDGFYNEARFYRVRRKFIAQWGIGPDPKRNALWRQLKILDDKVTQKNRRGTISFAQDGPISRTTQVFINLRDNSALLDKAGFAPFGIVVSGMDVVDQLYSLYGEIQSLGGSGPDAVKYETIGDEYLKRGFASLDRIETAKIVP